MVWQNMSPFPTPRMDPEEERELRLAAQARAGAEWALAALIARYQPPVLRYLTRLTGDPAQSHQIAERIFVRMERRLHGPHGGQHLRLWLLRAATETGLDALRHPRRPRQPSRLHAPAGPRGLLMDGPSQGKTDRLRTGLGKIAAITGSTRRQVRQLIWNAGETPAKDEPHPQRRPSSGPATETAPPVDPTLDTMNPQEELRHRLIRAVLAELPYGDAQCLALHLVAGLNQTEVARALGLRPSAARHHIVQGLQMFAHRYDATVTSLGVPTEIAYDEDDQNLSGSAVNMLDTLDVTGAPIADNGQDHPVSPATEIASDDTLFADAVYPDEYGGDYGADGLNGIVTAPAVSAPVVELPVSVPTPTPIVVDALPAMPFDDLMQRPASDGVESAEHADVANGADVKDKAWLEQPTMVPVLSVGPVATPPSAAPAAEGISETARMIPVLTPRHP